MVVSCSELKEELSSLVDGELEEHRQSALAEHLSICIECRADHDEYKGVGVLLKRTTATVQEAAPDLWSSIAAKLPSVCECIQEDLSAYLDGELIATAKEGVNTHLEQCRPCLVKFQELSKVTGLLSKGLVLPQSVEVDIWSGLKSRLNDDCLLIKSELSAFIDKEVATLRHRAITAHLTECEDCTRDFNELSQSGDIMRSYYQPDGLDSLDLWPAVAARMDVVPMEAARQKRRLLPSLGRRLYAVAAAAVLGIAAAGGIIMYSQFHSAHAAPVTAEAYLIDQSLGDPSDVAEAVVYDHNN